MSSTHSGLIRVVKCPGDYMSYALADKDFKKDEIISYLDSASYSERAYTSVQVDSDKHIELNCDLVYINHSCEPNVAFVINGHDKKNWFLKALVDIKKDTPLEFFYPSTEWSMDQAFDCHCKKDNCLGFIKGAAFINKQKLKNYFVNQHILSLIN
ncbi:hypothetical protein E3Q22_01673 [Wallemia mellicola]|uniref:SET domain-containing protein n=1 Tax=Wallemia mellicola TaxID=1708541 RepID=A0A4T0MCL1_9BASI|nr:hypothetical protein E3Q22_01673 [Wallemia mellicola]